VHARSQGPGTFTGQLHAAVLKVAVPNDSVCLRKALIIHARLVITSGVQQCALGDCRFHEISTQCHSGSYKRYHGNGRAPSSRCRSRGRTDTSGWIWQITPRYSDGIVAGHAPSCFYIPCPLPHLSGLVLFLSNITNSLVIRSFPHIRRISMVKIANTLNRSTKLDP
jgi:hypothetical protein